MDPAETRSLVDRARRHPRFAEFEAVVLRKHAEGMSAEQIAADPQVKGCFGVLSVLLFVGGILEAVNAIIQFAEWVRSKGGAALVILLWLAIASTAVAAPRPGFGLPIPMTQHDYEYWIRRKERDYEDALRAQQADEAQQMPLKSARELGTEAAGRGEQKDTNPYASDYFDWLKGWEEVNVPAALAPSEKPPEVPPKKSAAANGQSPLPAKPAKKGKA